MAVGVAFVTRVAPLPPFFVSVHPTRLVLDMFGSVHSTGFSDEAPECTHFAGVTSGSGHWLSASVQSRVKPERRISPRTRAVCRTCSPFHGWLPPTLRKFGEGWGTHCG